MFNMQIDQSITFRDYGDGSSSGIGVLIQRALWTLARCEALLDHIQHGDGCLCTRWCDATSNGPGQGAVTSSA